MDNIFRDNPELEVYYKTSDGEAFYKDTDAKNYAKTLKDRTITPVHRADQADGNSDAEESGNSGSDQKAKMSAQDAIKAIKDAQTLEELVSFKDYTQKTVVEALEKKSAELAVSISVNAEKVPGGDNSNNE